MLVITTELAQIRRSKNELIIGGAVLGALSVVLTIISQSLGLNFPIVPYLQFDLGEIAILLAFFVFGPAPAMMASVIEFVTLMEMGQNAPWGPVLKLVAIASSLAGFWIGTALATRLRNPTLGKAAGLGTVFGLAVRGVAMSVANYLAIIFIYTLPGILGFVSGSFKLIGVTLTEANALAFVLGFTLIFNLLQLLFVSAVSYSLVKLPQVRSTRAAGSSLWVASYIRSRQQG
jgi:riboflavin transporter FmnP